MIIELLLTSEEATQLIHDVCLMIPQPEHEYPEESIYDYYLPLVDCALGITISESKF